MSFLKKVKGVADQHIYNGSNTLVLQKDIKKDFNDIGIWFSSDPEYAKAFGTVRKFILPTSAKFLKVNGANAFKFLFYSEVYTSIFNDELAHYAINLYLSDSAYKNITEEEEDSIDILQQELLDILSKGMSSKDLNYVKKDFERLLEASVLYYVPYLKKMKKYLMNRGYDGLYFPKENPLDDQNHEAWVIFNPSHFDMKPIALGA